MSITAGVNRRIRTPPTFSSPDGAQHSYCFAPLGLPRYGGAIPPAYAGGYRLSVPLGPESQSYDCGSFDVLLTATESAVSERDD